ncbi:cold-shock protein [Stenotrophomonas cyclobalanopsidis]|uniref:cold-shock protein n=1 Tax=Stenotrophomonas cyclobalanopsidis TaxID=2771362 RepID=UPI0028A9524E|nr:cold-shock protein [Stenotrophomonas cyclobalanopsidis]
MKQWYFALAVLCVGLAGAVWMQWPAPASDEVSAYRKLPVVEYRLLRSEAMGYASSQALQGLSFHARADGAGSFEIRCKGVAVMAVENAPARVLLRMPSDALTRAPDVSRLLESFQQWLVEEPSHARLVGERGEPSWLEARLRDVVEGVPPAERCVFGGDREK